MDQNAYRFLKGQTLEDFRTDDDLGKKSELEDQLKDITKKIAKWQKALYAEGHQSLLIIMQGMDAAGKDSAIRAIFSGVNPQGVSVQSFKAPSKEEYAHDYLWRHYKKLPSKGLIGIFNRSHYENVLVTKVHPKYILSEDLPHIKTVEDVNQNFWEQRYRQINDFERTQLETGTTIIKFMLHVSQQEQHSRFLHRIENQPDNWKFSEGDWKESQLWDKYQAAYADMLVATSTDRAPWYVIPCDDKPSARLIMGSIILDTLAAMNPQYPDIEPSDLEASVDIAKQIKNNM